MLQLIGVDGVVLCISEKNSGHCKRIIGEIELIIDKNWSKNRIIAKFLSIIYQGLYTGLSQVLPFTGFLLNYSLLLFSCSFSSTNPCAEYVNIK